MITTRAMFLVAALLGLAAVAVGFVGLLADAYQAATLTASVVVALVAIAVVVVAGKRNGNPR